MKSKFFLIVALMLTLVVSGGIFAYTYTTDSITGTAPTAAGADLATCNKTVSQPDWDSILTPVEDTEILRPNVAGDETLISNRYPSSGQHWDKVDEETPDGDNTYVYTSSSDWQEDLYHIADHYAGAGDINYVEVYIVCRATANITQASAYVHIKTEGTEYNGPEETLTTSYDTYSYQWDNNPQTSANWTWDEIDALQIGVGLRRPNVGQQTLCTQVYAEVNFQAPALLGDVPTGDLFTVTPSPAYSGDQQVRVYLTNTGNLTKAYQYLNMKLYLEDSAEAEETPDYRLLTLQNGAVDFTLQDVAPLSGNFTQTSQSDFEAGILYQVDTTTSPGDVILDTLSDNVTDSFDDESKIASSANVTVTGGQVKLTAVTETETLRPSAAGDETDIDDQYPDSGAHWEKVDEASSDGDDTYISTTDKGFQEDLYNADNHTVGTGTINYVKVYMVSRVSKAGGNDAYVHIKTNGGEYNGTQETLTTGYATYSYQWDNNPQTTAAWTWDEIDALQIGVGIIRPKKDEETSVTQVYAEVNYTAYEPTGTITSENLLSGETVKSIDSFDYNASAIPSGTGLKVQFSQDNTNWCNSAGTLNGWDTLSQGTNNIDLSGLSWSGANFYYHMQFSASADRTDTPVLDEAAVNFSTYYASGDLVSSTHDNGYDLDWDWGTISFTINEPSATNIQFQIRTAATEGELSSATWYGPTGTGDYYTTTGAATNSVHDGDRWIQYKAYFTGPGDSTPTLSDISITYAAVVPPTLSVIGGGYGLNSRQPLEWENGWTVTPELYCEVTQR